MAAVANVGFLRMIKVNSIKQVQLLLCSTSRAMPLRKHKGVLMGPGSQSVEQRLDPIKGPRSSFK
jgi:hypothetical protein